MIAVALVAYALCGYALAVLCDTVLDLQGGPEYNSFVWFIVAAAWPVVLLGLGIFAALHTLLKR